MSDPTPRDASRDAASGDASGDATSSQLDAIVASYIDRMSAGEALDPLAVVAENPVHGQEILRQLEAFAGFGALRAAARAPAILGDYTLRRELGRGGMGVVYEAWQGSLDRAVALKVLPAGIAADDRAFNRFMKEAKAAAKLHHPNVVGVYGMGVEQNTPYYAMELIEGETLAQVLARIQDAEADTETPFGKKDGVRFFHNLAEAFAEVADGLQHAHKKGVIHRDIKPSNLILDAAGRLRILDFGLARLEGQESLTRSGDCVGTPAYMSPEQARRREITVDHRTDVYSHGATLYEALAGRPPFRGRDAAATLSQIIEQEPVEPTRINARVPKELETIVLKCLRKDAADRYGTAEALAQDLRRFVRGDAIEARPQTAWELLARRAVRHRRRLLALAAASVLLLVCGALAWRLRLEQETSRLYLAQSYEKQVVAAAMKLLRAERVLATMDRGRSESANLLSRRYQDLLSGSGKLVAEETVVELTRAIADLPDRFEAYHYRAKGRKLLQQNAGAIDDLGQCLRRSPSFLPARALLADLGDDGTAKEKTPAPPAPDGNDRWGEAWLRAHQAMKGEAWKEAAAAYSELLGFEEESKGELFLGSSIEHLIGRGVALMESKDFEGAKLDFWGARILSQRLWGELLEPLLLLGKAYVLEGHPSRAEELFRDALDRSNDRDKSSLWIAAAYQSLIPELERSGRLGEAVAAARQAVQFHTEDNEARLRLGWALLREGWAKKQGSADGAPVAGPDALLEVEALAAQVIARNPNDPFAHALWSKALEAQGKLVLASELAGKAEALLGGGDTSRRQDMNLRDFASTTAVAALTLEMSAGGRAHEPAGTFTEVKPLGPEVSSPFSDLLPIESGDGLTLAFTSDRPGGSGDQDMYIADRQDPNVPFAEVRNIAELNLGLSDYANFLSDDGLTLYFASYSPRPGSLGHGEIYFAKRPSRDDPFEEAKPVEGINSQYNDYGISLTADGLEAYFSGNRPGGKGETDIWVARRNSVDESFADVRNLEMVNTAFHENIPSISADGLTLFWSDYFRESTVRPRGSGGADIWCATRASRLDLFGNAVNLRSPINTGTSDFWIRVSPRWPEDGSITYFTRCVNCELNADIYQATWHLTPPAPRFLRGDGNADGKLDLSDGVSVLNHLFLGTAAPACLDAADANDDGKLDLSDAVFDFGYLFLGAATPPAPGPAACGPDPTQDGLPECVYGVTSC